MAITTLSSDIYQISQFIEDTKAKHLPAVDDNTLAMGIYGAVGDMFSEQIQTNIIVGSELANEMFPTRAKFERNILTHAIMANVKDINATPARMNIILAVPEKDLLANMTNNAMTIDAETPFYIEDFEFHLDYDIKVTRNISATGENVYVAVYDTSIKNKLSNIVNPYLNSPVRINVNGDNYIFFKCIVRQVEFVKKYTKIISDDSIENKSFEFSFENQLADFTVVVKSPLGVETHLTPIYDEMPMADESKKYCYYSYVDATTIRIKFIRSSYDPVLNSENTVYLKTTQGAAGMFKYNGDTQVEAKSDRFNYINMIYMIKPVTGDSVFGIDRKSIEDLKAIIPKENLSRGVITNETDLNNYFNMLADKNNRLLFEKKVDNQFQRAFYSYILLKDSLNNIIPSNTIGLKYFTADFDSNTTDRLVISPGAILEYDKVKGYATKLAGSLTNEQIETKENTGFLYTTPFMIIVNKNPLTVSYYLNIVKRNYELLFTYINDRSPIQFISTVVNWKRELLTDRNKYKLGISITQNILEEKNLVVKDGTGAITSSKIKTACVFYANDGTPSKYVYANIKAYDPTTFSYDFELELETDDTLDAVNNIKIKDLYTIGTENKSEGFLDATKCKMAIYVLTEFDQSYGLGDEIATFIPNISTYTLCNKYDIMDGLDFIINFSEIISSKIQVKKDLPTDPDFYYLLNSVPVVKYSYTRNESRVKYFLDYILNKHVYITEALDVLENTFGIDFKFFNTYGPSKTFTIGYENQLLDRVNLSLTFRLKATTIADENIKQIVRGQIKTKIENLNGEMTSLHMTNLCGDIKQSYSESIEYLEFVGVNAYGATMPNIQRISDISTTVPEFLNISSKSIDYEPDINIIML